MAPWLSTALPSIAETAPDQAEWPPATLARLLARQVELLCQADIAPDPESETILEEAGRLVYGPRQVSYGPPSEDFTRTGRMWGAILGLDHDVSPKEVGLCLAAVKISREVNAHKRDNLTDLAGYAATVQLVHEQSRT